MYERYYGLRERPFDLSPNPRFLCFTPQHREALVHLEYGLAGQSGLTVLLGEAGTGKTTLIRAALLSSNSASTIVHLSNPTLFGQPAKVSDPQWHTDYRTDNGGDNWVEITEGLPSNFALAATIHPEHEATRRVEVRGDVGVSADVLGVAVHDADGEPRVALGRPLLDDQARAVGGRDLASRVLHAGRVNRSRALGRTRGRGPPAEAAGASLGPPSWRYPPWCPRLGA